DEAQLDRQAGQEGAQRHPPEPAHRHEQRGVDAERPHRLPWRADDGHDEQQGGQDLDVGGEDVDAAGPGARAGLQAPGAHGAGSDPPRRRASRKTAAPTARVTTTPTTPATPPESRSSSTPSTP